MFEEPEGATPLDPDEMEGLKFKHISTRADLDEIEQANIVQGLRWLTLQRGGNILKSDFVCKVHTQLFGDIWKWAGSYRLTEKNIGIDPVQISVQLRYLLDDARYWAENKTYAPPRSCCAIPSSNGTNTSFPEWKWTTCTNICRHVFGTVF